MESITLHSLSIAQPLYEVIEKEIAPGTGIEPDHFFKTLSDVLAGAVPENRKLLEKRVSFERQIDEWYRNHLEQRRNWEASEKFLRSIGYLLEEPEAVEAATENVDPELAELAGPQLVVPVDNARYCLNAANARWGSLYDAYYGTDVLSEEDGLEKRSSYNPKRGRKVMETVSGILDAHAPLATGSHNDIKGISLRKGEGGGAMLEFTLMDGQTTQLKDEHQFAGYREKENRLEAVLLKHHGLHFEIQIDPEHPIGSQHPAGIKDILAEAAVTTIQDFEDSVSAVDAEDKARVYRNWTRLLLGTLETDFEKDGRPVHRKLNPDREYKKPDGSAFSLPGRSMMLVRNVGIHMFTNAVQDAEGNDIPEGILDLWVTALAAKHDLKGDGQFRNSRTGSVYIVKPKMHGPEEVAFVVRLFGEAEKAMGLEHNTIKIGIMDEERRTTVNLKACIHEARERIVFINTGFLDRTGDEIHTAMEAGLIIPKMEIKQSDFMLAYEDWNVDIGLETALPGHAQIGKGMWTMPDEMKAMCESKGTHPREGATTAWVPSPTAATLHALHYHEVDVAARQNELAERQRASLAKILTPPLMPKDRKLSDEEINKELENNAQGILGYAVRWVDQGIGCSKIPDIRNIGLMEDRATLRISSQHIANWLYHGFVSAEQVRTVFERVAKIVDQQNSGDPNYRSMAVDYEASHAFQAALELVFEGRQEPNGYTERVLHRRRRLVKQG